MTMAKPLTIKLTGTFEMPATVSIAQLSETITALQAQLVKDIGPGTVVLKIGRQELRA